ETHHNGPNLNLPCQPCLNPPCRNGPNRNSPCLPKLTLTHQNTPNLALPATPCLNSPRQALTHHGKPYRNPPAIPNRTLPQQAPAYLTGQKSFYSTWNIPLEPSFPGRHSPTPQAKPPMLNRLIICSMLIALALYRT